jgi:SAM-dependent methyltransferase
MKTINVFAEPSIRALIVKTRAFFFIRLLRRLKSIDSQEAFSVTVKHNIRGIMGVNNRMNLLIYPVSIIESVSKDAKILVIGPRNENDIYSLVGQGFKKKNIVGCDLISYTPNVVLGDMHHLPFDDNFFDVVICGWTLSYSSQPQQAVNEMKRVLKNDGVLAIGVEYSTLTEDEAKQISGYTIQEFEKFPERINSVQALTTLVGAALKDVFFAHDAPNKISHRGNQIASNVSNVAIVTSISK